MFGPGIRTVFTSRWKAVWWSLGILATAYCTVPAEDQPGDAAEFAKAMLANSQAGDPSAHGESEPAPQTNPWK